MITQEFTATVIRTNGQRVDLTVEVELGYDAQTNPLAVTVTFDSDEMDTPVRWFLDRDLFVQATNTARLVGAGDVCLRNLRTGKLSLRLSNPHSSAEFLLPADQVREFLANTTEEAALGAAAVEEAVDALLAEILG